MTVDLRAMAPDEFPDWCRRSREQYVESVTSELGYTVEAAREKADRDFQDLLPDGIESDGQRLLVAQDAESGEQVGYLWFGERMYGGQRIGFVWDIEVFEDARGRGYGRAIMTALEERVQELGIDRIDLNVFGQNHVARALYRSLGYQETSIAMTKHLDFAVDDLTDQ